MFKYKIELTTCVPKICINYKKTKNISKTLYNVSQLISDLHWKSFRGISLEFSNFICAKTTLILLLFPNLFVLFLEVICTSISNYLKTKNVRDLYFCYTQLLVIKDKYRYTVCNLYRYTSCKIYYVSVLK